jgi:hypothetical protein
MYYMRSHRKGLWDVGFGEAIRGPLRFALIEPGLYHKHLRRYLEHFDRSQLHVILLEDFRRDPAQVARALYRHLGADDSFSPPSLRRQLNRPRSFRLRWLRRLKGAAFEGLVQTGNAALIDRLRKLGAARALDRLLYKPESNPAPDPADTAYLREIFAEDVAALEKLLERDLSEWISPPRGPAGSR